MSLSNINRKNNALWRKFADSLKRSEDHLEKGIQLCEQVRRHLEQEVKRKDFSIAATFYAGSVGKHTDVINPNFDMVMKINNRQPPFTDVLEFIQSSLRNASHLNINQYTVKTTPFSVQFSFTNGVQVDLLPAAANLTDDQVLQKMKRLPNSARYYYSSSLVEAQVGFMKKQTALAHNVARLAKCWFKNMNKGEQRISGDKLIFELLAVAAVLQQHANPNATESVIDAFRQVVVYLENIKQLYLEFEKKNGNWCLKSLGLQSRAAVILEPSNPCNNLLDGAKREFLHMLVKNAKLMRERLDVMIQRGMTKQDMENLFYKTHLLNRMYEFFP